MITSKRHKFRIRCHSTPLLKNGICTCTRWNELLYPLSPLSLSSSTLFILGLLIEGNGTKNQSNTISQIVLRLVRYLNIIKLELFGEFNNYFRTQLNQSISIDPISSILFGRKTNKSHPVSIESEKSPSSMHVKQFEKDTNISINPEVAKVFLVKVI